MRIAQYYARAVVLKQMWLFRYKVFESSGSLQEKALRR